MLVGHRLRTACQVPGGSDLGPVPVLMERQSGGIQYRSESTLDTEIQGFLGYGVTAEETEAQGWNHIGKQKTGAWKPAFLVLVPEQVTKLPFASLCSSVKGR